MDLIEPKGAAQVYIVVLNWNGWEDTLACLESIMRSDYPAFRVIVCDNASTDGSPERIKAWAAGKLEPLRSPAETERRYSPIAKPIACLEITHAEAQTMARSLPDAPLTLLHTGGNLGYAGGNNAGLRYALARGDADYCWVLNNDLVIASDALSRLVERMSEQLEAGLCGSVLLDYHAPERVQALGGATYNPWLGTHRAIGAGASAGRRIDREAVERRMSYVIGAALFVSRRWLDEIGLLCEDYFLYFEEIDWAVRGRGRGRFQLAFAPRSRVYHKGGGSTGRPSQSPAADYLALHNRLRFTRKHIPWALPTVWLGFLLVLANRLRRGQFDRIIPILAIMLGGAPNTRQFTSSKKSVERWHERQV
ncbi:rhamnosyl transferase related protein [Nitrococcus mobilis Nb-231]|uniref:Rhamnosyl transferase related protein n=2 Tax=Nitrococcus mobilis TaxID=35797 RepID=A4BNE9_9GAMM|nr:rhamnosyl transferase related protein [Nitrococcus mobilis Nb-231]